MRIRLWITRLGSIAVGAVLISAIARAAVPNLFLFLDPTGQVATFNVNGAIDRTNPFFQSLGTNGRTCASCHVAGNAFGLAPAEVQARFVNTQGTDPVFAPVDGANCPDAAPGDTLSRSLLLSRGLIRIALPVPTNAEYTISVVSDPYHCAIVDAGGQQIVSVYRRPLPTTNLRFLSAVMFDGRESVVDPATGQGLLNDPSTFTTFLRADLAHQAVDATLGHAQALVAPGAEQVASIVDLELGFFSAQARDNLAGPLYAQGASGGPSSLSQQPYYPGVNDSLTPSTFNAQAFTLFGAWQDVDSVSAQGYSQARERIAMGQQIFNTKTFEITSVRGLNDNAQLGKPPAVVGTCTTCHDTPNVGNHSLPLPLDIATSHAPNTAFASYEPDSNIAAALEQLSVPDLPVYLISGCPSPFSGQPVSFYTSDPAKALITGACSDFNRGKGPILRGLAARAPYFHNGAAATLDELVNFYNRRFNISLSDEEKIALIAFLNSL
jgi:hypothetical protein